MELNTWNIEPAILAKGSGTKCIRPIEFLSFCPSCFLRGFLYSYQICMLWGKSMNKMFLSGEKASSLNPVAVVEDELVVRLFMGFDPR